MQAVHHGFLYRFLLRWFVCSLGLWIAAGLLNGSVSYGDHIGVVVVAGLILAAINAVLKPIIVLASIPAILLTLGLFMLVINGVTVYLASKLYAPLEISSFGTAILTGIIIGLVNYLVTAILEERN
jgi:putative membrane protein